uniref:Uncharacterized protein n=1 Tax=Tanacetum cinerariifolium TaxID=118510 RepID=A0A699KA39_TANCI|nr:hypothetical protein [Tanacetum cinerariifolium]
MQKRRNDVKARTTLLLALPDEHQLTFSKYETTQELWGAILKTFGRNEATKKTKKNQLKQHYGNFKAKDDLDTMSLDDVYNHLKVYEPEVQKKSESNSQNMAFISSANTSSGKDIASQSNGSQIKYEDITHIDKDDIKEMDINQWWSALITTRWAILLGSAEYPGVKIGVEEKATDKVKKEKKGLDSKLKGFKSASKDLDTHLGSQRSDKNKEGLGYSVVPPSCSSLLSSQERYVLDRTADMC